MVCRSGALRGAGVVKEAGALRGAGVVKEARVGNVP